MTQREMEAKNTLFGVCFQALFHLESLQPRMENLARLQFSGYFSRTNKKYFLEWKMIKLETSYNSPVKYPKKDTT